MGLWFHLEPEGDSGEELASHVIAPNTLMSLSTDLTDISPSKRMREQRFQVSISSLAERTTTPTLNGRHRGRLEARLMDAIR